MKKFRFRVAIFWKGTYTIAAEDIETARKGLEEDFNDKTRKGARRELASSCLTWFRILDGEEIQDLPF